MPCFLRQHHIRTTADFRRAYELRRTAADRQIVVFACANGLNHPRLGVSASRRLGGAVVRNRWKRLLREAFRLTLATLPPGVDLVVIPRPTAKPTLHELLESLPRLAAKVARAVKR
jgi:ribonuclease P protein component